MPNTHGNAQGERNIGLWVNADLYERARLVAADTERSMSGLARMALREYVERYERTE